MRATDNLLQLTCCKRKTTSLDISSLEPEHGVKHIWVLGYLRKPESQLHQNKVKVIYHKLDYYHTMPYVSMTSQQKERGKQDHITLDLELN